MTLKIGVIKSSHVSVLVLLLLSVGGIKSEFVTSSVPSNHLLIWSNALLTTFFISIVPYLILFIIPLDNSPQYQPMLKLCLSFASGGLLGDAFLHLIPEALEAHTVSGSDHRHVGIFILAGFITFLVIEKIVRLVKSEDDSRLVKSKETNNNSKVNKKKSFGDGDLGYCQFFPAIEGNIKISGYLNLAADFTHNFTDGLAIGSSFLAGEKIGFMTGLVIMLHEVPHEIGDFAVLLKSGCSRRKAMQLQLITAVGALAGTLVSLIIGGFGSDGTLWILPFTGGGFIYIATVSVLAELAQDLHLAHSIMQLLALGSGIMMMTLITTQM